MIVAVVAAYGTDPNLVRNMLLQVAARNPLVLKEPAPHALFDEFGDSTLNFVLRVYMASRNVYLQLRHELLSGIAHECQQLGIEIAFPQRDIHIRSVESPSLALDKIAANDRAASASYRGGPPDGKNSS